MKKVSRFLISSILVAGLSCVACQYIFAQGGTGEDRMVTAVNTKNNKSISTETILSKIRTKAGDKFSQEVLNDDLKRLYATEYFTDVSIDVEDVQGGVAVTFILEEKPVIDDIVFKGNEAFRPQKLKSTMKSKANEMLNMALLAQDINEIKSLYEKKGYPMVEVDYKVDIDKELNKAIVTVTIDEKTKVKVTSINITGNKAVKTNAIKKVLGTKTAWLFNSGVFKEEILAEDVEKIKALYDDIGYLDAAVNPKLDYSDDKKELSITFEVDEGKQYRVGDISITGNLNYPESVIMSKIKMVKGKPFSNNGLRADISEIRHHYFQNGYVNASIDVERNLNQSTGNIDISLNIDSKEVVYVGKVEIRGNLKTRDTVIRRELRILPGDRFNGDKIKRSKERLYNLGYFEDIAFDTEPTEKPDVNNLIVTVKETKTGEFAFGGGYSSIDQLIGFVSITQKNFDILNFPSFMGGGQNLVLKAELGMVRTNYNISWTDPWIFGYPYMFGFDIYRTAHRRATDVGWPYDETRTGGDLRLGKEFTDTFRGELTYRLEEVRISDVSDNASQALKDESGTNWISSLMLQLTQDTRDNIYNPTKGYVIGGSIEDAGGIFFGDKDYVKGTGTASYYHLFYEKVVLEVSGRFGLAGAYGDSKDLPVYERFYAGGANTIRGYKERRVGPKDPGSGEPIGGDALAVGNIEATFPIFEKIMKGAIFYDVGNVWEKASEFIVDGEFRQGAGVGVRVKTPVGPVKLDYGYPLTKKEGDDTNDWGELYFSMSHGF